MQTALSDEHVQEYLDSDGFLEIPASERLVKLVEKIRKLGLRLDSHNLGQIHSGLPDRLSDKVKKADILRIGLPKAVYDQLQTALSDERVQEYLDRDEFLDTPANERLVRLVEKIRELGLRLDSDNLGQLYSGLPDRLSDKVKKLNIQKIELPKSIYDQLQMALSDERVQEYLDSNEFMAKPANERLVKLVEKIRELGLRLDSDNLEQVYSGLPDRLSDKVKKADILGIGLPKAVYDQLQATLFDERVQKYLDSNEFMDIPASERLVRLVARIRELGLRLDSDNLGHIYSGLPDRLSRKVNRSNIQKIELPKAVYDQLQTALSSEHVQKYLDRDEFLEIPASERLVRLVARIRELGLRLDSDNLGHIYSGLPDRLSDKVKKADILRIGLPKAVYDQRVQEYQGDVINFLQDDNAMLVRDVNVEPLGGIDFNLDLLELEIQGQGRGFNLPDVDRNFEHIRIDGGLFPVIINITPITNLPVILGATESEEESLAFSN